MDTDFIRLYEACKLYHELRDYTGIIPTKKTEKEILNLYELSYDYFPLSKICQKILIKKIEIKKFS